MIPITYVIGDACKPIDCENLGRDVKIIAHICNDVGAWGRGFVLALDRHYPEAKRAYRKFIPAYTTDNSDLLGYNAIATITLDLYIFNMIAQHGLYEKDGVPPIRYDALSKCLSGVWHSAQNASVHMPRIGCGLALGSWSTVKEIIEQQLSSKNIPVYVYDLKEEDRSRYD